MTTEWDLYQRSLPWYNRSAAGVWARMVPTILAEVVLMQIGKWGAGLAVMLLGVFYTSWWAERDTWEKFERWKADREKKECVV